MRLFRFFSLLLMTGLMSGILFPLAAQSIYDLKRAELEVHVGPAIPLGSFGQKAFQGNEDLGSSGNLTYHGAKVGVDYGLAFNFYASPHWGVVLFFNGHSYGLKTDAFSAYQGNTYAWQTEETDKWTEFMAMAGPTYRCMIVDRLLFSARAFIGYAHLMSPFYRSRAEVGSSTYAYSLDSESESQFGYGAGVALKFLIGRGFHLDLRCEYLAAVPFWFRDVRSRATMESGNINSTPHDNRYTFHEHFQTLNVSLGFTVAF